ncbi:family 43 glycosylhydrolase [Daejeonella sp.]|uniref:family 43 glycosylhydrolase n=1 Tax=Daejeonella sp. TaxID=2805397 RepID=UPI0030BDA69E
MKVFFAALFFAIISLQSSAQKLVMPGDYPDPSVVKIGNRYWASATSSNWFPAYPLLVSKDLIKWEAKGYVFNQLPAWADYYFWAPEISYEKGKVYIYYTAHKRGGNLCVGIASADKPEGPYTDHGPLICQEAGSIDAFPMRDKNGKLFMIWKEDGNSVKKPTPIWAQEMNEGRTALTGEKKELFRGTEPWEGELIEGVSMIRNGEYFYAFYAAAACCGRKCNYGTGIARAKDLLGPWEKYSKNPVITHDDEWKCPGHGTPIEKNGKYYFLYHAYENKSNVYAGRQGLLSEFKFTSDGWIEFEKDQLAPEKTSGITIKDDFNGAALNDNWQWSIFQNVSSSIQNNILELNANPVKSGAYLGQKTFNANYKAGISVLQKSAAEAGLAAIGDDRNLIRLSVFKNKIRIVQLKDDKETIIKEREIPLSEIIHLSMKVSNGKDITFSYSTDGNTYQVLQEKEIDGSFLPPWDRAVRIGPISNGSANQKAYFKNFSLVGAPD